MGDTWGISGPTFLIGYAILAVVVLLASIRARRAIVAEEPAYAVGDLAARPHDVAYLNGGPELAVVSALTALRLRGAITSARGTAQAVPGGDAGRDELERAIFAAVATPTNRKRLPVQRAVAAALGAAHKRLATDGLVLSDEQRRRVRSVGYWMLAVAGLGLVRLLVGIADAKPVGFLVLTLLVVAVIAVILLANAPRRTKAGDRALAGLRDEHHALAPGERPDWTVYGPVGAALGIGLFGMSALWASDPAIAGELAAQRMTSSGGDGAWWGGGDGGGGGCGGGGGGGGGGCGG